MSNSVLEKKLYVAKESPEPLFDLSGCNADHVPKGIYAIIKVIRKEYLHLQNNKLNTLKDGGNLSDLSLLKVLDISHNKFTKLPSEIKYLSQLRILRVDNNELTTLPNEIGELSNLEYLSLSSNKLKKLPDSVCNLKKLQHLDLKNNPNLRSLPCLHENSSLQQLVLDEENDWKMPSKDVVKGGIDSIQAYFAQKNGVQSTTRSEAPKIHSQSSVDESLHQLSTYDKYIQDKLRRLEKEKEEKLIQQKRTEQELLYQMEQELLLHRDNQNKKEKLLENLIFEQRKIDEEVSKCQKQKELEQLWFINRLQFVESSADEVIRQLIETNNAQKREHVESLVSSLANEPLIEVSLKRDSVLASMEELLANEYFLSQKLLENDISKQNLVEITIATEADLNEKVVDLLSTYKDNQSRLLNDIKQDSELQYAAVLMLIEKTDFRNIELQNQMTVIENQLGNLTALELKNRSLHMDKYTNELAEKRYALSVLLSDIFAQQQLYKKQLMEELRETEARQNLKNADEFWLMQYQRLMDRTSSSFPKVTKSLSPALIHKLALFGVSHCAPFLCVFDFQTLNGLSSIKDGDLKTVGVNSEEDREGILKAVQHFIDEQQNCSNAYPSAPLFHDLPSSPCSKKGSDTTPTSPVSPSGSVKTPTAPPYPETSSVTLQSEEQVLINECVVCLEIQSNIVFLSCGHLCCCAGCSVPLNECPICRCDIKQKIRIFTA